METRNCTHCGDDIPVKELAYSSNKRDHAKAWSVYCSAECKASHEHWLGALYGEAKVSRTSGS
jgi:hypothetical protein